MLPDGDNDVRDTETAKNPALRYSPVHQEQIKFLMLAYRETPPSALFLGLSQQLNDLCMASFFCQLHRSPPALILDAFVGTLK